MSAYRCCCGRVLRTRAGAVIHVTAPHKDGKAHRINGI